MNFFTSDTHFKSDGIIEREMRPFKDKNEYAEYQVDVWNGQAKQNDDIWVVGDFLNFNRHETDWKSGLQLVTKIKANVNLVIGNNEERVIKIFFGNNFNDFRQFCIALGFKDVYTDKQLEFNGRQFYLTHHPKDYKENMINLFGHTHRATGLWKPFGINVGVDINHFRLFSEIDIELLLWQKENYWDKDKDNLS